MKIESKGLKMKMEYEWKLIGNNINEKKEIYKCNGNLTKKEFEHLQIIDQVCRQRKYSITDLIKIFLENLSEETAEEIIVREDIRGNYPIEI